MAIPWGLSGLSGLVAGGGHITPPVVVTPDMWAVPFAQPREPRRLRAAQRLPAAELAPVYEAPGTLTLLQDNFTDANGTALSAHTMLVGPGWTVDNGTPQISGNKMVGTTNGDNVAYSNAGYADITLTAVYVHQTNTIPLLLFRRADANHYWIAYFQSGTWQLQEYVSGYTTRGTAADTLTAGQSYSLRLVLSGASVTLSRDGTPLVSYGSASTGLTATRHGLDLAANGSAPSGTFNSFLVTTP